MGLNLESRISFCNFSPISANKYYSCYKRETCCVEGCCINGPYHIYQVWYYWFIFLIIFGIISGGSWLCKKPRPVQPQQSRNRPHSNYAMARCSRRRCPRNLNNDDNINTRQSTCEEDIILDRLFVSFRNRNALVDPPSYSSIIPMDYSAVRPKLCPLYSYYGPPPTYSSAAKPPNDSPTQKQESRCSTVTVSSITQIQVHSEESTSQLANNTNKEDAPCSGDSENSPDVNEEEPTAGTSSQNN